MATDEQSPAAQWADLWAVYMRENRTLTARAEAAEQRAEALAAEVARLRADALVLVGLARTAAIYDLNGPDTEAWGEALLLADGLSSADVAEVMRRVLRGVAESQPAEVSDV